MNAGRAVDWTPVKPPRIDALRGEHVELRPVRADDAQGLYDSGRDESIWTWLPYGPFATVDQMRARVDDMLRSTDPLYLSVVRDGQPQGIVSYLRITPEHGTIEIGHIWLGTPLQRTTAATEAIFLLARHVFDDLGYRRLEWKTNSLNEKSRRAAERFGFTYEGTFRNHQVVKGHNRDTAWFAMTDDDWPYVRAAFEAWLDPANFDEAGAQREPLRARPQRSSTPPS